MAHDANALHGSAGDANSAKAKQKQKKSAVIAGVPPQEMSGTVKMLFKEVAAIRREQKASQELERVSNC